MIVLQWKDGTFLAVDRTLKPWPAFYTHRRPMLRRPMFVGWSGNYDPTKEADVVIDATEFALDRAVFDPDRSDRALYVEV